MALEVVWVAKDALVCRDGRIGTVRFETVEDDVELGEKMVPSREGAVGMASGDDSKEAIFYMTDGPFGCVGPMIVGWHELKLDVGVVVVEESLEVVADLVIKALISGRR